MAYGRATALAFFPMRPPVPPFTEETARQKVQAAEDAWNTRDPERVAGAARNAAQHHGVPPLDENLSFEPEPGLPA